MNNVPTHPSFLLSFKSRYILSFFLFYFFGGEGEGYECIAGPALLCSREMLWLAFESWELDGDPRPMVYNVGGGERRVKGRGIDVLTLDCLYCLRKSEYTNSGGKSDYSW